MLREAVANPLNQRFILLSEACFPLYPPEVMYLQLLSEDKVRINICGKKVDRQHYRRAGKLPWYISDDKWSKSSQWFSLTRQTAKLLLADSYVGRLFRRYCHTAFQQECVSDEHQIPTTLAMYGLEHMAYCPNDLPAQLTMTFWHS